MNTSLSSIRFFPAETRFPRIVRLSLRTAVLLILFASVSAAQPLPPTAGGKAIPGAAAGRQPRLSLQDLSGQSDLVVLGRIAGMKSSWNENRTRIYTIATIEVSETWKGASPGATLDVRYPGGEIDGVGELYSHTVTFRSDEEVVVFARKSGDGINRVVGGVQGKMTVISGPSGEKRIAATEMPLGEMKRILRGLDR